MSALCEGLMETTHPYNFVAQQGLIDLLQSEGAQSKLIPILKGIILPLRNALAQHPRENVKVTLKIFKLMVDLCGKAMLPYIKNLLPPLGKHITDK